KPHAELLFQYAASGFRDFTRIAGSSPEMWRDISLANRVALLDELDGYLKQLINLRGLQVDQLLQIAIELDGYLKELINLRGLLASADGAGLEAVFANAS